MLSKQFLRSFFVIYCCAFKAIDAMSCVEAPPVENFQPERYEGYWSEYLRTIQDSNINLACTQYLSYIDTEEEEFYLARLWQDKSDGSQHLLLQTASINETAMGLSFSGDSFTIIDTDYDNYGIVFGCDADADRLIVWIVTREIMPSYEIFETISKVFEKYGIHGGDIDFVDHEECPKDWSEADVHEVDFLYEDIVEDLEKYGLISA